MVRSIKLGSGLALAVVGLLTGCALRNYALTPSDKYVRDSEILEFNIKPSEKKGFKIELEICNSSQADQLVLQPFANVVYLRVPDTLEVNEDQVNWAYFPPTPLKPGECFFDTFDILDISRSFEGANGRYECRLIYISNWKNGQTGEPLYENEDDEIELLFEYIESEPLYLVIRKNESVRVEWE